MARRKFTELAHYFQQLAAVQGGSGLTDAELVERYVRYGDEASFELLLWRHGALVFNVCRRLLTREEDAEDAFQATFLTFVRKAHAISRRGSVASWLYKVAYRVALEARKQRQKIAHREKAGVENLAASPSADPGWEEWRAIFDEELTRLPERLRRPFVLCHLEGKSNEEAARELGCRLGTIYSRLSRGREMLRHRLKCRGVTLSAAALTAALAENAAEAVPAVSLMKTTVQATLSFADLSAAGNVSPRASTLAEGVLRTMFLTKIKMAALVVLVVCAAAGGVWTHRLAALPPPETPREEPKAKREVPPQAESKPIAVQVVKPKPGGLPLVVSGPAEVVAAQQQQLGTLIAGIVKEVTVDIGDRVKKGQVLIVLDAPLLAAELEQAMAALEMAEARVQEARATVAAAEAEIPPHTSGVKIQSFKLDQARAALKTAEANVRMSRAVLNKARIQLSFTQLTAAFDGVVTKRTADPGNFVQPIDSRLLQPLLTVQRLDTVRAVVRVAGRFAPFVERGKPVELTFTKGGVSEHKIARFSPTLDGSDRMMIVEIDVPNPKGLWLPGMYIPAKLHLTKASPDVFTLPSSCLVGGSQGQGKGWIYVVREGKAHRTQVELGVSTGDKVEVLMGLQATDRIVTDPMRLSVPVGQSGRMRLPGDVVPVEITQDP